MPPEEVVLRIASIEDVLSVSELLYEQYIEHRIKAPMEELLPAVEHLIRTPEKGLIFVACKGKDTIGTAVMTFTWSVEHRGRIAWLDELYVIPEWRDRSIGSMLLRSVMERAEEKGCRAIELEVDHEHKRAEGLYVRNGFEVVTRNRFVRRSYPS